MTIDELDALEIVDNPRRAVWREDADPHGYWDKQDMEWIVFRLNGRLVRAMANE
jgi:hypothetical protein